MNSIFIRKFANMRQPHTKDWHLPRRRQSCLEVDIFFFAVLFTKISAFTFEMKLYVFVV